MVLFRFAVDYTRNTAYYLRHSDFQFLKMYKAQAKFSILVPGYLNDGSSITVIDIYIVK